MQRLPRPGGLTLMVKNWRSASTLDEQDMAFEKILRITITHYINNGYTYMGKPISISELAELLKTSSVRIMREIARYSKTLASISSPESARETSQALTGLLIQNTMQDRAKLQSQADMLNREQKGKYVAFLSKETNVALKNLIDSNKPLMEIIKIMQGPASSYIQNNHFGSDAPKDTPDTPEEELLTTNEAVRLLDEAQPGSLLEDEDRQEKLLSREMNGEDHVEVIAIKQKGFEIQGSFALEDKPMPIRKGKHIDRNEDDGDITEGIEDVNFEPLD